MQKLFLILCVGLFSIQLAKAETKLDSLKQELQQTTKIANKLELSCDIGEVGLYFREGYWDTLRIACEKVDLSTLSDTDKYSVLISHARALNNLGYTQKHKGKIPLAIKSYAKSLEIGQRLNDKPGVATGLNNLAVIYDNQGDLDIALEYHIKGLKLRREIGDKRPISISLNNVGAIYHEMARGESSSTKDSLIQLAVNFYTMGLELRKEIKDSLGLATSYMNLGASYRLIHNSRDNDTVFINKSLNAFKKSLFYAKKSNYKKAMCFALNGLGGAYYHKNNIEEAKKHSTEALAYASKIGYPRAIANAANSLYKINKHQQNWSKALEYYELKVNMMDSINNETNQKESIKQ